MSQKIENIDDLRDHALNLLQKLEDKKIKVQEAGITAKIYESIISTVKTQMEYARMLKVDPDIPFLGEIKGNLIEHKK